MSALQHAGRVERFAARSNKVYAVLLWGLAAFGLIITVGTSGPDGLLQAAPLLLLAFAGWALFWHPAVIVSDTGVELRNPVRSVGVPWDALAHVDTKFALTLITGHGKFAAWAAPAPGIWGARHAKPDDLRGLPTSSYGPADSVRPGDLLNTVSGQAARMVRSRWAEQLESGRAEAGRAEETPVIRRPHWAVIAAAVVLTAAAALTVL